MSIGKFLWNAIWREFGVVGRAVQIVLVTLPLLATAVFGFLGGEWSKDQWHWTTWAYIAFGTIICVILFGIVRRAYKLEKDLVSKILISDPKEYFMPWRAKQDGKRVNRHFYITITNGTIGNIINCSIGEFEFENNTGHIAPPRGRLFRLKSEREANVQEHTYTRQFQLRGKGDEADIDICSLDEGKDNSQIIMYYATKPTEIYPHAISRDLFPSYLTINVTADNLAQPERRRFKIYISQTGDLKMESTDGTRQASEP